MSCEFLWAPVSILFCITAANLLLSMLTK